MTAQPTRPEDVPDALVDIAMAGAAPGCRDDARFYLANALPVIREEIATAIEAAAPAVTVLSAPAVVFRAQGMSEAAQIARGDA